MAKKVEWKTYPYQKALLICEALFILVCTGLGAGKTWIGARKAALMVLKWPGVTGLIAANSYKQLRRVLVREFAAALDELGLAYRFVKSDSEFRIKVPDGSGGFIETIVIAMSMENYDDLRGVQLGWGWLDEGRGMSLEAFQVYVGRLRDPGIPEDKRQTWITTTPNGFDWIYSLFTDKERKESGNYVIFHGKTTDNWRLGDTYVKSMLSTYDEFMVQQELEGKFINLSGGALYYNFDRSVHVSPKVHLVEDLPIYLSWDNNPDPLVCTMIQEVQGETWVIGEIVKRQGNIPEVCKLLQQRLEGKHDAGLILGGDAVLKQPSITDKRGKSSYKIIAEYLAEWYKGDIREDVSRSNPPIVDRVISVNMRLRNAQGRSFLFIHESCRESCLDFEQVQPEEGRLVPNKKTANFMRTHASDTIGYHCVRHHGIGAFREDLEGLKNVWR